jgi:predicted Rdx family selenoprotein
MKVKIVHCPTSQNIRAKVTTLVTLIEQRLGIKAVTIPGTTGQFEVSANGQRIAERGGNWFTRTFDAGYPDLERVVEQLEKRLYTISFINTATIEVEQPGGPIYTLTLPEGCSIPEEFNVGSKIEIIMIDPARYTRPTYWKIMHIASKKVIEAIVSGLRPR